VAVRGWFIIPKYYAHSRGDPPRLEYQPLDEHLLNTAKMAEKFAKNVGAKQLGYWAGILHDIGKYTFEFQSYLVEQKTHRGPDHSSAGAVFSLKLCELLAIPLAGHHAGLADLVDLQQRLKNKTQEPLIANAIQIAKQELDILQSIPTLGKHIPAHVRTRVASLEFFVRMLFSCLVDADYSDTESFCNPHKYLSRRFMEDSIQSLFDVFISSYLKKFGSVESTDLNNARKEIFDFCLKAASEKPGIFRLTVPTGGGKTLASMGFALLHALKNDLDRVIVAIPYTSIIEQTVDVYRSIFGYDKVLEHHSAVEVVSDDCKLPIWLAADNWDARIIVTTTVQLFESLFSNRPSKCRKNHNIANSVLILDEVQTLPLHLLSPILDVLQELVDYYRTTVVLCTATQPALDDSPYLKGLKNIKEIIPDPDKYFSILKRVDYQIVAQHEKWSWSRVAKEMRKYQQCMVVVNTKKDALKLLDCIRDEAPLHLSTLMCGAHRRKTLTEVKRRLDADLPCYLVATQVVEAGVNLDFPVVMRAVGPLDRIVQAAGRCNREGKLKDVDGCLINGKVIIFEPEDGGSPPGAYRSGTDQARVILSQPDISLHDPNLYEKYFKSLYQVVDTDSKNIQKIRESKLSFAQIAERFKMIADTSTILVNYPPEVTKIEKLKQQINLGYITRELMRDLQPYLVSVYSNQINRLLMDNLISELVDGFYEWKGIYDPICGIVERDYDPESLIF